MADKAPTTVSLDRFTRGILTALTVLLTVIAVELWANRPSDLPVANAQIPDTGYQRQQIVDQIRITNSLLEQVLQHLRSKPIQVTIKAEEGKGKTIAGPARSGK